MALRPLPRTLKLLPLTLIPTLARTPPPAILTLTLTRCLCPPLALPLTQGVALLLEEQGLDDAEAPLPARVRARTPRASSYRTRPRTTPCHPLPPLTTPYHQR